MARAGRKRKLDVARFPSGQIRREDEAPSPTLAKRASMMGLIGLADPAYGTVPGIFYLSRKIDSSEYEAAKRFADLYHLYLGCLVGPKPPAGQSMERGAHNPIDVDSTAGERELARHVNVQDRYKDAQAALLGAGNGIEEEIIKFCHGNGQTPEGWEGMIRVRKGLAALIILWKVRNK